MGISFDQDVKTTDSPSFAGLTVAGSAVLLSDYASISFDNSASATTIPAAERFVLAADFDTNGPDNISTADQANNRLTAGATRVYDVRANIAATAGGTNKTYEWYAFVLSQTATTITAATQANPVVITAAGHGLSNGQKVAIKSAGGMTEINDQVFTVSGVSGADFSLQDDTPANVDGTGFTAYTTGGTVQLATQTTVHAHRKFAAADVGAMPAGDLVSITSGDHVELYVKGITDATNITHESTSFYMRST